MTRAAVETTKRAQCDWRKLQELTYLDARPQSQLRRERWLRLRADLRSARVRSVRILEVASSATMGSMTSKMIKR